VYFGAFFAAVVGAFFSISHPLHIMTALLAGSAAGLLYALIPALLKTFLAIDEMITTLMFNYIAILLTEFFTMKLMGLGANTNPDMIATPEILNTAKLGSILPSLPGDHRHFHCRRYCHTGVGLLPVYPRRV
jgi:simple sugar transport system permease protein